MSFILDALRKSENERQQQGGAEFATVPTSRDGARAPRWIWVLVALLVINVTVLLGLLMRDDTPGIDTDADVRLDAPADDPGPSFAEQVDVARRQQPVIVRNEPAASPSATGAPARSQPDQPAPGVNATPSAQSALVTAALPTLTDLRADGTLQLPDLHLDIHVYSDTPSERFVFINMVRHRENSRLAEGPVVSEITPDGVVLDYGGTRFLLPRE